MRKQVYSNGKDRNLDLGFEVPYNNDLKISLADGSSVPFVMYKRNAVRFTKDIPEGDVFLDIEESMPTVKPVKLDNIGLSLIRQKDIDRLNRFSQELGIKEEIIRRKEIDINALAETIKALETQNSQKIDENLLSVQQSLQELYGVINSLDEQGKARDVSLNDLVVSLNNAIQNALQTHIEDFNNPHNVKKEQIGLGNVDNTADIDKPISKAVKKALDEKLDKTEAESIREEIKKSQKTVEKIHTGLANMTGGLAQLELPRGGKEDQLLAKASNKDGHFKWIDSPIIKHNDTLNRDDADCHPISAITGLQDELDLKLPTSTKYGSSLSLTIDSTTFIMTAQLKDQDGNNLGTAQTIDLPMESVVVSGYYDSDTKEVVLTLQSGSTIRFSVADLVSGLQDEITVDNKLSADLVDDTSTTNKFVTSGDISNWNGKYDASNPDNFQENVIETVKVNGSALTPSSKAVDITVPTDTSDLTNGAGFITGINSTDVTNALGYTPYNSTNPSGYQANVLEGVQVNGTDLTISSKKVNVPVPTTVAELTDSSNYVLSSSLATVATSGLYSDLTGTPTIPTVNNAKLTIQKNGTSVGTFTANASSNKTVNITVPTDTGDLTNNAGFITGISSGDVTTALGYTPYDSSNPNGYTSNVGTVISVNNTSPDGNGNVSLTIPTVNNPTIKITQGGITKGSFTLNQSSGDTIDLDAGGGSGTVSDVEVNGTSVVSGGVASITVPTQASDIGALADTTTASDIGGANKDLSNLSSTGKNIGNWSTNISNCITEIPQDIKLEFNNGTITLKAGSKVYFPNGSGIYDEYIVPSDLTMSSTTSGTSRFLFLTQNDKTLTSWKPVNTVSGDTDSKSGTTYHAWYDTANNLIKCYGSSASTVDNIFSFPIALISCDSGTILSIDQVFNGFGYIGSTIFALPGVKGLIPNGRNDDGTLKNIEVTTSKVLTQTRTGSDNFTFAVTSAVSINAYQPYVESEAQPSKQYTLWYKPSENLIRTTATGTPYVLQAFSILDCTLVNGIITSFTPKTPFRSLDYNDKSTISGWAMPSSRYIDLTLGASGATYTAPANGYISLQKVAGSINKYIALQSSQMQIRTYSTGNGSELNCWIPVAKGNQVAVYYNATGTTNYFRFIYAKGEE